MKPKIISILETTLCLNPRLKPSWTPRTHVRSSCDLATNQDGHDTREAPSGTEGACISKLEQCASFTETFPNQIWRGWRAALGAISVEKLVNAVECVQRKSVHAPENNASVRAVSCDLELLAILSARITSGEPDERGTVETHYTGRECGRQKRAVGRRSFRSVPSPKLCGIGHGLREDTD